MKIKTLEFQKNRKQIKLCFQGEPNKYGSYNVSFNGSEIRELYDILSSLTNDSIWNEDRPYVEDISTYSNEVERLLSIKGVKGSLNINLICYTDDCDDNWIGLSARKIAYLAGLIYPYI